MKELVNGKLFEGISGKGGGYRLIRNPKDYSVGEILELMEGTLAPVACLTKEAKTCSRASHCKTFPLWEEYNEVIHNFFFEKSLSDLIPK